MWVVYESKWGDIWYIYKESSFNEEEKKNCRRWAVCDIQWEELLKIISGTKVQYEDILYKKLANGTGCYSEKTIW